MLAHRTLVLLALCATASMAMEASHGKLHKGWVELTAARQLPAGWTQGGPAADGEELHVRVSGVDMSGECSHAVNSWIGIAGQGCGGADMNIQWTSGNDEVSMTLPVNAAEMFLGAPGFQYFTQSGDAKKVVRTLGPLLVPARVKHCVGVIHGVSDL